MKVALFIGRFQPFHLGHKRVIETALANFDKVLVAIGSANSPMTPKNPLTVNQRSHLIHSSFSDVDSRRITTFGIDDSLYDDIGWTTMIQREVRNRVRWNDSVTLIGHSKDHSSYYLKIFPTYDTYEVPNHHGINSTDIRNAWFAGNASWESLVPTETIDYLKEFISNEFFAMLKAENDYIIQYKKQWESCPYPPTFVTTDAVVMISNHVLLVTRKAQPGKGLLALPGGFLGINQSIEDSMLRELTEETKIKIPTPVLRGSIVTNRVYDHPDRSSRGRTITHAYLIHLKNEIRLPKVKGSDDALHAQWVNLNDIRPDGLFEDHYYIIKDLVSTL